MHRALLPLSDSPVRELGQIIGRPNLYLQVVTQSFAYFIHVVMDYQVSLFVEPGLLQVHDHDTARHGFPFCCFERKLADGIDL